MQPVKSGANVLPDHLVGDEDIPTYHTLVLLWALLYPVRETGGRGGGGKGRRGEREGEGGERDEGLKSGSSVSSVNP